jgi:ribosomal protein L37AE/L43A
MISQRCPKCNSHRVRRGYKPTPIWSKILFRYNLLCDNCNWEFVGFAVPGTVTAKPKRSKGRSASGAGGGV